LNFWIKESIRIANAHGYLDALMQIYPPKSGDIRKLDVSVVANLRSNIDSGDDIELVTKLLSKDFPVFPIKDPYVAFLRKNSKFIKNNPKTVARLANQIRQTEFEKLVESLQKPIEFNRQIGPLFNKWKNTIGFPVLPEEQFLNSNGITFLDGSDEKLKDFANKRLAVKLLKGLDLIAKVGGKFILAEVKFITEIGGHQQTQFENALQILKTTERANIVRIAILDGVVWIKSGNKMHKRICQEEESVLSALLLKKYLNSQL